METRVRETQSGGYVEIKEIQGCHKHEMMLGKLLYELSNYGTDAFDNSDESWDTLDESECCVWIHIATTNSPTIAHKSVADERQEGPRLYDLWKEKMHDNAYDVLSWNDLSFPMQRGWEMAAELFKKQKPQGYRGRGRPRKQQSK